MRKLFAVLALAVLVVAGCGKDSKSGNDAIDTSDSPAVAGPPQPGASTSTTSPTSSGRAVDAPWSAPTTNVSSLIQKAGLDVYEQEKVDVHYHSHLDVFVDGQSQPVPAQLGIDLIAQRISPLHTHDETGIIHIESDKDAVFRLGQLFVEWNVRLDATCVGSYCSPAMSVEYYVDGTKVTSDPAKIEFARHREIAIVIGKAPASIPKTYNWPQNT